MDLSDLLKRDHVVAGLRAGDKPRLVAELARRGGEALRSDPQPIEAALSAREGLGSTGLGKGFALPHARLASLDRFFGLFARLTRPIEFEAIDERPVDLVFLLLMPERAEGSAHVSALAAISRRMRETGLAERLRGAVNATEVYGLLTGGSRTWPPLPVG